VSFHIFFLPSFFFFCLILSLVQLSLIIFFLDSSLPRPGVFPSESLFPFEDVFLSPARLFFASSVLSLRLFDSMASRAPLGRSLLFLQRCPPPDTPFEISSLRSKTSPRSDSRIPSSAFARTVEWNCFLFSLSRVANPTIFFHVAMLCLFFFLKLVTLFRLRRSRVHFGTFFLPPMTFTSYDLSIFF